jgi:hypothetical protein
MMAVKAKIDDNTTALMSKRALIFRGTNILIKR